MLLAGALLAAPAVGEPPAKIAPEQAEFFETRIRPVLVEQCYKCHNSTTQTDGSLALDYRGGLLEGGDGGLVIVPGKPAQSRLLPILRHEVDGLKMPKRGGKLDARVIADFEKWIAMGAPDPRDKPPTAQELERATSWGATLEKRKQWWSFQPIRNPALPPVHGNHWSDHPLDRFIQAKLEEKGLEPGGPAEPRTLVRRLFFTLTGLPPTAAEVEFWTARLPQPAGYAELVDHLLASPHFGECWARHWMDWIRYAESHGSEGDPAIDNAWVYRDYLIRALNADVGYDQLVREHIAGDLLERPRINAELGINESAIGPAHWRMVFHGFAPTDALEEKVRFVDDEINTFSKAFLGLTVSCARCHDHKFDPISQRDYYALFGVLGSCRPGRAAINSRNTLDFNREKLASLKPQIRSAIGGEWLVAATKLRGRLLKGDEAWKSANSPSFLLHPWFLMRKEAGDANGFPAAWKRRVDAWEVDRKQVDDYAHQTFLRRWNLASKSDYAAWFHQGSGLPAEPFAAGEFSVAALGDNALTGIYPAGVYSHTLTAKHAARLSSGYVPLNDTYDLWVRSIGDGGAAARYVVQDYPRNGSVYPVVKLTPEWKWQPLSMAYWNGDEIHIELTTAKDAPLLVGSEARSWFGVREALIVRKGNAPPPEPREYLDSLFEVAASAPPKSFDDLADCYVVAITGAIKAWQAGTPTDAQALLLDTCLRQGLLPNRLNQLGAAAPLIEAYRRLEADIPVPTRVPGLEETIARNQRLLVRGNHKQPADEVPRRFLEAIDATPYQTLQSGRRELAEDLLRGSNPLTRRVIVNRLWHHLFGRGIVATPDNFGKLGQEPTHPEMLDYLATRFKEHDGSLKETIRFIVTSKTWQLSSRPSPKSMQVDPENQFLSHAPIRRLEAEAIRDELLAVSGSLNPELFGSPVDGAAPRRSIYVGVRRTALDPFLRTFDFPEPFSATGRRDVTNVPAQSLTLMNDEHVARLAAEWAARILADTSLADDDARIRSMFLTALGRPAQTVEVERFNTYLAETKERNAQTAARLVELRGQVEQQQAAVEGLVAPTRKRLLAEMKTTGDTHQIAVPRPIARWDFKTDLNDTVGSSHGVPRRGARVEDGALVVNNQGHVITAPLKQTVREKTLEAWVQLDTLDQRGGGVMTLQTPTGAVFDSIVFAEKDAGQWLAGSNFFKRTQSFNAPAEREAATRAVHVAIAYHADGTIAAYRDGLPYGTPYKSNGPIEFKAGEAVVGFGIRHLPGGGNAFLAGRILRAQLYDRALTADEIRVTSQSAPTIVSNAAILAALPEGDRQQVVSARERIAKLEAQIAQLGPLSADEGDKALWTDAARAMFSFKEFIYLK